MLQYEGSFAYGYAENFLEYIKSIHAYFKGISFDKKMKFQNILKENFQIKNMEQTLCWVLFCSL